MCVQQSWLALIKQRMAVAGSRQPGGATKRRAPATKGAAGARVERAAPSLRKRTAVRGLSSIDVGFEPHVAGIRYGVLDELVGYAIRRAELSIYTDLLPSLQPWGMTPQRYSSLSVIAYNPGLRMSDLAHIIGVAFSGAAIVVQALERLGYITRDVSKSDRRVAELRATAAGRKALNEIEAAALEADQRVTAALTATERSELLRLLAKLGR